MQHIMIDLETLGTAADAVILSIGAVRFDPFTSAIGDTFYIPISIDSNLNAGRRIQEDTLKWWMAQSPEARAIFKEKGVELAEALQQLNTFIRDNDQVWGNGAAFDITLLDTAYQGMQWFTPWKFWNVRCYRTLKALPGMPKLEDRVGVHHNALDDAISQAKHLQQIMNTLGMRRDAE